MEGKPVNTHLDLDTCYEAYRRALKELHRARHPWNHDVCILYSTGASDFVRRQADELAAAAFVASCEAQCADMLEQLMRALEAHLGIKTEAKP